MNLQSDQAPKARQQNAWFDTAAGLYLQHEEQIVYDQAVVDLFGFNALQMGLAQMDLLRNSRIAHRFSSSDCLADNDACDLLCCDDFLPIAEASIDLLLLPHRLEFSERPHQTLREAARVIVPEGHLLISGFNRFSFWGIRHFFTKIFGCRAEQKNFPWKSRFIGLNRLKDWLILLGFEVVSIEMCCHIPPFEQAAWHGRFRFMHRLGMRWLSFFGGVYFIVARKRVACMTPLKPNWKNASLQSGFVVRPTQRGQSQCDMQRSAKDSDI